MKKYIQLFFADPTINAADHFDNLLKAVDHAQINLNQRYKIKLFLFLTNDKDVVLEVDLPESENDSFNNPGNRLKGISSFLIHYCNYKQYCIGSRLLFYKKYEKTVSNKIVSKTYLYESDTICWYLVGEQKL